MDNDNYLALSLEKKGSELQPEIIDTFSRCGLLDMCYAYKSRVKPEEKLIEKKNRKLKEKPDYGLEKITDLIGMRFVTLFRRDMASVVTKLIELLLHKDDTNPNPFYCQNPEEIIIYSTNYPNDAIANQIKDELKERFGINEEMIAVEYSNEGYSSIHVVTRIDERIDQLCGDGNEYRIPIEIQIRTVFEDAWGEIDHKYGYVIRTGKLVGSPINNPEYVMSHLQVLKKFSDACAEYADVIYDEANDSIQKVARGRVISVESDDDLIARFRELALPENLIERYLEGREKKASAQKLAEQVNPDSVKKYLSAADVFRQLSNDSPKGNQDDDLGLYLFRYYCHMNEAICLLSTGNNDEVKAALVIYKELEKDYDEFPFLKMRLGQAHGKLGNHVESIKKFEESRELTKRHLPQDKNSVWSDQLPEIDYKHMQQVLPRLLGFQYWSLTKHTSSAEEKRSYLWNAYCETEKSIQDDHAHDNEELKLAHNNLLYYAVEYLTVSNDDDDHSEILRSNLKSHLQFLEDAIDIKSCLDIEILDTFIKAYNALDDHDQACETASRVLNLALGSEDTKIVPVNQDVRLELAQYAYTVLNS